MKKHSLKYSCGRRVGYKRVVSPRNSVLKLIDFGMLRLSRGERRAISCSNREIIVLLLSGRCTVEAGGEKLTLGPRKDIFTEQPWTFYARGVSRLTITANAKTEALISAAASRSKKPSLRVVPPEEVVERAVGTDTYARRVRTAIGEDFPAERLLAGETINQAGKWSSYPPHRHEKDAPPHEARLEEVYYYRMEKRNGFGVQRIYTDDGRIDETHTVRDGDVCVLPRGYHPISAAPSSKLYYFWVLAGKNRKMQVRVDPNFA